MKTYKEMTDSVFKRSSVIIEKRTRRRRAVAKAASIAACLSLVAALGVGIWKESFIPETSQQASGKVDNNKKAELELDSQGKKYALYTPSIELPENIDGGVSMDMRGCLVYKGKVYTQGEAYYGDACENLKELVGDYMGEAVGSLNEWSSQEDYAKEFASTYTGSVYSVNGYSDSFRLCIYIGEGQDRFLQMLENYDAIGLSIGSDLFDKRLHLPYSFNSITYQSHDDWNNDVKAFKKLSGISDQQMDSFILQLCECPFEFIDYKDKPDFYDTEVQGHLYFEMKDGTQVELRLIDGGYAGYQNLGWYFVKLPEGVFNEILSACQQ